MYLLLCRTLCADVLCVSRPLPFKCSIKPRSAKAEALITSLSEGSLSEG